MVNTRQFFPHRRPRQPLDPVELDSALAAWFKTPYGTALLARELTLIERITSSLGGFRAMQLGPVPSVNLLDKVNMLHRFRLGEVFENPCSEAVTEFDALPLPSGVVDIGVVHHLLDYCELPHEALKEAARVVVPSGHLLIIGFNPLGWIGLAKWPMRLFTRQLLWRCRSLPVYRVHDWLRLLGFHIDALHYGGFQFPLLSNRGKKLYDRLEIGAQKLHIPSGAFYVIVARKQVLRPLDSQAPAWLKRAIKPVATVDHAGLKTPSNLNKDKENQ